MRGRGSGRQGVCGEFGGGGGLHIFLGAEIPTKSVSGCSAPGKWGRPRRGSSSF